LLREEFLKPMGIRLAKEIGVPPQRIGDVVAGKRAITADTDLRLWRFFGLSNGYWLRAQVAHDTEVAGARWRRSSKRSSREKRRTATPSRDARQALRASRSG
jgi:antitoxin HigA-1